jgi:hypothetical protein
MPQLVKNPNSRVYLDTALTKVKEWFRIKIQGLTLNKSCSLVAILQTLFMEQSQNCLEVCQIEAQRFNLLLFSALRNYSKSGILDIDVSISRSHDFVKQLDSVPK